MASMVLSHLLMADGTHYVSSHDRWGSKPVEGKREVRCIIDV